MIRAGGLCVLALIFGYSGWRALRRQPIWIPDVSDDLHRTAGLDARAELGSQNAGSDPLGSGWSFSL